MRTIIDRRAVDILRKRNNTVADTSREMLDNLPDTGGSELDKKWNEEWRQHSLAQAVAELRNRIDSDNPIVQQLLVQKVSTLHAGTGEDCFKRT